MPSKFQSACLTGMRRNAFFKSILLSSVPGPRRLTMAKASSTEQYESAYVSGLIKSLILLPGGADK